MSGEHEALAACDRSGPHPGHRWAVGRGGRDLYWCEGVEEPVVVHASDEQRNLLLEALLSTPDLRRRFHRQADFHHAVQLLVRSLPMHVELLAQSADEAELDRKRIEEYLMRNPGPAPFGPDEKEEQR